MCVIVCVRVMCVSVCALIYAGSFCLKDVIYLLQMNKREFAWVCVDYWSGLPRISQWFWKSQSSIKRYKMTPNDPSNYYKETKMTKWGHKYPKTTQNIHKIIPERQKMNKNNSCFVCGSYVGGGAFYLFVSRNPFSHNPSMYHGH